MGKVFLVFGLLALTLAANAQTELTQPQGLARKQGLILYNQYKAISATPFLAVAAEAGDHEAQYYLAESLRKKSRYMDAEALKWYEASGAHGDIYAMIRLGRSNSDPCQQLKNCPAGQKTPAEWLVQANKTALLGVEKGDAESMYLMYEISLDRAWLSTS